ncbi:uncharacterized protein LOC121103347 isoform X1 [Ursus maritimus]|uniref:Uncharacterized protein LOC121103347 isoform X1 n=1 Tax=Ursus maritimus TaxID=29073 RepID=A0A8M1FZW4_URSMA|nr:uncharacterized protein LOC121103347 isoform X1 [Ursus maritimus]
MEMWLWSETETRTRQWVAGGSRPPELSSLPADVVSSWVEDRKFILRGWCLIFSVLATLMVLSVVDGRLAYLQGSYTGFLGIWTDCRKHKCANLGQVPVLIHMSMGFMMLALILCLTLLPTMCLSFQPVFRRLTKIDLVFSSLSFSIGFLIVLSLTLFVVNCETLQPRPQVSYLVTTYLCWAAGALMLWTGALSYLNHLGIWRKGTSLKARRVSNRRWALQQNTPRRISQQQSDADQEHTVDLPSALNPSSLSKQSHTSFSGQ